MLLVSGMVGVLMLCQTTTALFKRFVSVDSSLFIICFKNLLFVKWVRLIVIHLHHKQTEIPELLSFVLFCEYLLLHSCFIFISDLFAFIAICRGSCWQNKMNTFISGICILLIRMEVSLPEAADINNHQCLVGAEQVNSGEKPVCLVDVQR